MSLSSSYQTRYPVFKKEELHLLASLVNKYSHILERKRSNATAVKQKKCFWDKLAAEFNSQGLYVYRSVEKLKKRYYNGKNDKIAEQKAQNSIPISTPNKPNYDSLLLQEAELRVKRQHLLIAQDKMLFELAVQEKKLKVQLTEENLKRNNVIPLVMVKKEFQEGNLHTD
ncbi:Myb/SANT-like DNA-binding domain [Cinara cedri]|uniref:Regulatory protein zeste n=1 Tax=Cinara cedri TaxID=506608 RepID=A0A5E4NJ35_9HEMI|nr:Myb/SANT-like DNA-binding domain [Cinara cedri]